LPGKLKPQAVERHEKPLPDKRGKTDLQGVCFIDSIPGKDEGEGIVVLVDGTLRQYISCRGINALFFDANDLEQLAKSFTNLAHVCDSDIQILVRSRELLVNDFLSRYQARVHTDNDYLNWYADYTDKWFRRVQEVHFVPQRDFYVVVTYQPPGPSKSGTSQRSNYKQKRDVKALAQLTKTAYEQLRVANLRPQILTRKEVRNLIYSELNPALARREPEATPASEGESEASALAASALKVMEEYLWLDGRYVNTQYLQQVPHVTWLGWLVDLLTLPVEFTLSLFIHPCDQAKASDAPDSVPTQASDHATEGMVSTEPSASVTQALRSSDKSFDLSMYITTSAESTERLLQNTHEIRRVFKSRGAVLDRAQLAQLGAWQSTLPVAVDKLGIVHRVKSPTVGTFWPFFTAACGTPDGAPFGFALASREPVLLNPFFRGSGKDTNNMLVVGGAGSGKSFAVSMLVLRLLPCGTQFVVIDKTVDKTGSYRFITELLGSDLTTYVDLGPVSGMILNPFDLGPNDTPGKPSAEKIIMLLSLLDLMLAPDGRENLSVQEKSLLDGLIRAAYLDAHSRDTVPTMSDLSQLTAKAAADETDPLQRDRLQTLARGLTLFTKQGAYGGMLDGETNIDTDKQFLVFDTREINEPLLERIAQFILAEFVKRRAAECKSRLLRFATVIDQAATWMRSKTGALLLDDLSRQARHYGMMLVCITQQLKDFFRQSELADSVVKNSQMKLILRHDAGDLKLLKDALHLSDAEVLSIENFARDEERRRDSQCLLMVGNVHGTIRLVPSPMDYWICTSEPINDIPRRMEKIKEVKVKNPKLSDTDAARQAVYYLGLGHDN
jgi:type IV secretory pathway VirB4 component